MTHLVPARTGKTACGRPAKNPRPLPNADLSIITCRRCRRTHAFLRLEAYNQLYPYAA